MLQFNCQTYICVLFCYMRTFCAMHQIPFTVIWGGFFQIKVGHDSLSGKKYGYFKILFYKQSLTFLYTYTQLIFLFSLFLFFSIIYLILFFFSIFVYHLSKRKTITNRTLLASIASSPKIPAIVRI